MQLIEAFVRNPVKVAVGVLLVALFGFIALFRLPKQLTPEVEIPKVSIETRWPGASPEEVEREIVQEQEEQLQSVEGVTKLSAECANSVGTIILEFPVGTDLGEVLTKVNARLQQVPEYPEDADEPIISTSDPRANAIAWFILRPRVPSPGEVAVFQEENPDLAELVEPIRRAHSPGLAARRVETIVAENPDLVERLEPLIPEDIDVPKKRLFAEDYIEAAFERVEGVSNANVYGGREEEMQVIVDPQLLAARGLTIMDIRRALRAENRDISGGDLWEGKRRWVVRTLGRFRDEEMVKSVIVAQGPSGEPIYLGDVAEVELGYKKPTGVVKNFGTACLAINCVRETGANVLDTMEQLQAVAAGLNADLLKRRGLELVQVYDETEYINDSINVVQGNILYAGLLTVGVLLLFLRSGRSTLVIFLAIPTSIIGTFLLLDLMGRSLNVISLAGLAFAVGMLVDNAVVVLENCYRHAEMGDDPFRASVRGAGEVWGAVVASTLTTLAVFLPVLFVQEEAGQLFRDIALAISAAVGLSLIVSITVIPCAAARLLRAGGRHGDAQPPTPTPGLAHAREPLGDGNGFGETGFGGDGPPRQSEDGPRGWRGRLVSSARGILRAITSAADLVARAFINHVVGVNRFLQRSIFLRLATALGFIGAAVLIAWLLMPKVEYLPEGNRNLVFGIMLPPPGYNVEETLQMGVQLEEAMRPFWDVNAGDPANEQLEYPAISDYFFVATGRQVFIGLKALDGWKAGQLVPLVQNAAADLPGTITIVSQRSLFSRELATGRTVDVEITGPELPRLVELARGVFFQVPTAAGITESKPIDEVLPEERPLVVREENGYAILLREPARAFPKPSLDLTSPELHVLRKTKQAADLGVTTDEIGYTVDALIDGAYAADYYIGGDKIDLTILGSEEYAQWTQDLGRMPIAAPSGELIPLEALADVKLAGGPEQINRRERQRAITISVTPPQQMPLEEAIDKINAGIVAPMIERGAIGDEYRINLAGTADKLQATWEALRFNFVLALLITYLLMAALFESWLYPFVIILTVPFGAVGGLIGLWALNGYLALFPYTKVQSLDVLTMLGFVILIGTVVNNAILIVHQSLNHMREEGMAPNDAILQSVRTRIRPIFMTTTTTVLGLAPLVLAPGQGSELYRGLGAVVLGGLLVSTAFTLLLVPVVFSLLMEAKATLSRLVGLKSREEVAESPLPECEPVAV